MFRTPSGGDCPPGNVTLNPFAALGSLRAIVMAAQFGKSPVPAGVRSTGAMVGSVAALPLDTQAPAPLTPCPLVLSRTVAETIALLGAPKFTGVSETRMSPPHQTEPLPPRLRGFEPAATHALLVVVPGWK